MNDIKTHFEKEAHAFDEIMLKLSPYYSQMLEALVAIAFAASPEKPKVLDLGSGTGNVSRVILECHPDTDLTCLDISENMIAIAKQRLSNYPDINYINCSVEDFDFQGTYDVIVSSLALHHVKTAEEKQNLYLKIYNSLNAGGAFFNADVVTVSQPQWQKVYQNYWVDYMLKSVPAEEIENKWLPRHKQYDSPQHWDEELTMLKRAGFTHTEVAWKYFNTAVYGAIK